MSNSVQVHFEGIRDGGEFWGGTQADFLLVPEAGAKREVSVVLTDAAAATLAAAKASENDAEFRAEAARSAGVAYLEKVLAEGRQVQASTVVTADMVAEFAA